MKKIFGMVLMMMVGCGTDVGPDETRVDGRDDAIQISNGMGDGFGIEEGGLEAVAILSVATTFTHDDFIELVGLHPRTARNLIEARVGLVDETFNTLQELDDVPYFGPVAINRFRTFVATWDVPELPDAVAATGFLEAGDEESFLIDGAAGDFVQLGALQFNPGAWNPKLILTLDGEVVASANPRGNKDAFLPKSDWEAGFEIPVTGEYQLTVQNTGTTDGEYAVLLACVSGTCLEETDLSGGLRDEYLSNHVSYDYYDARRFMFSELHNENGVVECVYTGTLVETDGIPNHTYMNTEHTWPQSKGARGVARTDLHHLFPTMNDINADRGSYDFCELPGIGSQLGSKDGVRCFEVQEDHKGNVARAMFYFSTMYELEIDSLQEATLREWHQADPVDAKEIQRNDRVAEFQGSRNPFVDDASLVDRITDF